MSIFKPARQQLEGVEIVANLDDIVEKKIGFVLHGKTHQIKPITTKEFFNLSNALAGLWAMQEKPNPESDEVLQAFYETIHSVCETITFEDIKNCTQAQIAAIFDTIMTHIMGKAHLDDSKKKILMPRSPKTHLN